MTSSKQNTDIVPFYNREANIKTLIYTIRGQQVMLDSDFAMLYEYEVKYLNRQVKRNSARFPVDFMFQLTNDDIRDLRCNFGTANLKSKSRTLPYAFTEQGIYMLATVLKGALPVNKKFIFMKQEEA